MPASGSVVEGGWNDIGKFILCPPDKSLHCKEEYSCTMSVGKCSLGLILGIGHRYTTYWLGLVSKLH